MAHLRVEMSYSQVELESVGNIIRDPIEYQTSLIENFARIVEMRGDLVSETNQDEIINWLNEFRKSIRVDKYKLMITAEYETLNQAILCLTAILRTLIQSINRHKNESLAVVILRLLSRLARVYDSFMTPVSNKQFADLMTRIITSQDRLISDLGHRLIAFLANRRYSNALFFRQLSDVILQHAVSRNIRSNHHNLLKVNPALAAFTEIVTKLAATNDWPMSGIFKLLTKYVGDHTHEVCVSEAYFRILAEFVLADAPETAQALSIGGSGSAFLVITDGILYGDITPALVPALVFMRLCADNNLDILSYLWRDAPITRIIEFCHHEQHQYLRNESWRCLAALVRYDSTQEDSDSTTSYFNDIIERGVLEEALECWNESLVGEILGIIDLFAVCIPVLPECCFDARDFISKTLDVVRQNENESMMMGLHALHALYDKMAVWGTLGEFEGVWEEMDGSAILSELELEDEEQIDVVESFLSKISNI